MNTTKSTHFHVAQLIMVFACGCLGGLCGCDRAAPVVVDRPLHRNGDYIVVYWDDWGYASSGPQLIFGLWPDGYMVCSTDPVRGGSPYGIASLPGDAFANLVTRWRHDGLFSKSVAEASTLSLIDHHGDFITIEIRSGSETFSARSGHECEEQAAFLAHLKAGKATFSSEVERMRLIAEADVESLRFRAIWNEVRLELQRLAAGASRNGDGSIIVENGLTMWRESTH